MLVQFFQKLPYLKTHHQIIFSLIVFFGVSAVWWSGYVLFDEYFFPNHRSHFRIFLAAFLGIIILILTNEIVDELL